ncbi:hypothetical protein Bca101_003057 [Brassica carinata]
MPQNDTAITPFDQNSNSKAIKAPKVDWNEVDVKSISEILVAMKVSKSDPNSQTTSEGCSTPFSKRKDGDLPDMSSSSKKLCTKIVKVEKSKKD